MVGREEAYRAWVLDEDLGPAEGVLGGVDGQVPEQERDALDGEARPVRPRVRTEQLVALQEGLVLLPEGEPGAPHLQVLHQPEPEEKEEKETFRDD